MKRVVTLLDAIAILGVGVLAVAAGQWWHWLLAVVVIAAFILSGILYAEYQLQTFGGRR